MKIVSGGQTGVDRAALDAAIQCGIPYGGWVPKGRLAEDGTVPARYRMKECDSADYAARTEFNVRDSDATLILCRGEMNGGTQYTHFLCLKHKKPVGVVNLPDTGKIREAVEAVLVFIEDAGPAVLNVAGPRESKSPGIYQSAFKVLAAVLEKTASKKKR